MRKHYVRPATLACAIALLSLAPALFAQNGMEPQDDKAEMMAKLEKMSSTLQLSPAQKQKMAPILMEEATQLKGVKSNTSLPPMQKAMKMRQIANAADAAKGHGGLLELFYFDLTARGIWLAKRGMMSLSIALDEADADKLVAAVEEFVETRAPLFGGAQ